MKCVCCLTPILDTYLDLGLQPLANDYDNIGGKHQLAIEFCKNCSHSQITNIIKPSIMFDNYYYISGISKTFHAHFKNLASHISKVYGGSSVLDIGCNDGTLLKYFKEFGYQVFGVDPAKNLLQLTETAGIPVKPIYWGNGEFIGKFDIITATNVFAHTPDPYNFLCDCKKALNDNGVVVIEFPYIHNMLKNNAFDIIYHEHVSYYTIKSVHTLILQTGLKLANVEFIPIHGGSLRLYLKHSEETPAIGSLLHHENDNGLHSIDAYNQFGDQVRQLRNTDFLRSVAYGAAAKCTVAMNYLPLNIHYAVDDNRLKWGKKIPGTNIVIHSPEKLVADNPEVITICAWNLWDEIVDRLRKLGITAKLQRYIPKYEIC